MKINLMDNDNKMILHCIPIGKCFYIGESYFMRLEELENEIDNSILCVYLNGENTGKTCQFDEVYNVTPIEFELNEI